MNMNVYVKDFVETYADLLFKGSINFNSPEYKEFLKICEDEGNNRIVSLELNRHDSLDIAPEVIEDGPSDLSITSLCSALSSMLFRAGIDPQEFFPYIPFRFMQSNTRITSFNMLPEKHLIRSCAFHGCSNLKEVTLPEDLVEIESYAFAYCYKLKRVVFKGTIQQWQNIKFGSNVWTKCPCSKVQCVDGTTLLRVKQ